MASRGHFHSPTRQGQSSQAPHTRNNPRPPSPPPPKDPPPTRQNSSNTSANNSVAAGALASASTLSTTSPNSVSMKLFADLAKKLRIDPSVANAGQRLWAKLLESHLDEMLRDLNGFILCVLYVVILDRRTNTNLPHRTRSGSRLPALHTLLQHYDAGGGGDNNNGAATSDAHSSLHVVQFMHKLKTLLSLNPDPAFLPDRVKCRMLNMEKTFTVCSAVYHKFEKILPDIFRSEMELDTENASAPEVFSYEDNRRLCWVLFLYAKEMYMHSNYELIFAFNLFLCCLDHVIRSKPSYTLKSPYDRVVQDYLTNPDPHCVLKTLCDQLSVNYDELCSIQVVYWDPLVAYIPNRSDLPDLNYLEQSYHESYVNMGELNEMLFLDYDPVLVAKNENGRRHGSPGVDAGSSSSANQNSTPPPPTPIKAALQTVNQLTRSLESIPDGPSDALKTFFDRCSINPSKDILDRVKSFSEIFVARFSEATSSAAHRAAAAAHSASTAGAGLRCGAGPVIGGLNTEQGKQRVRLATRLYFRVLETLLQKEEERLSQVDFSTFLGNQKLHLSLLALSVEVVLAAYGQSSGSIFTEEDISMHNSSFATSSPFVPPHDESSSSSSSSSSIGSHPSYASYPAGTVSFPWVLDVFRVEPFDFFRVCESFIKAETSLPKDLIKHINSIETKILEYLAWQSGSPLFEAIRLSEAMPMAIPSSPVYHRTADAVPCNGSSAQAAAREQNLFNFSDLLRSPTRQHASTLLKCFFNKVYRLVYHRLLKFCGILNVSSSLQHKMWTCLQHVICRRPELMRDRHVDQMIMCSIYAMCRVSDRDIKFKTLVQTYKENFPRSTQDVYKKVPTHDDKRESIIDFYNKVFAQSMKPYLMQFSPTRQQMPPLSPIPLPPSSTSVMSSPMRQQHPQRCNVSLLNESSFRHHHQLATGSHNPTSNGTVNNGSTTSAAPTPPMTPQTTRLYCFGESPGPSRSTIHSINAAVRSGVRSGVSRNLTLSMSSLSNGNVGVDTEPSASSSSASSSRDHSRHASPVNSKEPSSMATLAAGNHAYTAPSQVASTSNASAPPASSPGSRSVTRRRRLGFDTANESSEDDGGAVGANSAPVNAPPAKRGRAAAALDDSHKEGVSPGPRGRTRGSRGNTLQ